MPPETGMQRFLRSKAAPYAGFLLVLLFGLLFAFTGLYHALCFGGVLMGVLLYIIPKMMGADVKKMAVFGAIFFIVLTVVSAMAISKPMLEYDGEQGSGEFTGMTVNQLSDGTFEISVTYEGSEPVILEYYKIVSVWGNSFNWDGDSKTVLTSPASPGVHTFTITASDSSAYAVRFVINNDGDPDNNEKESSFFIGPVTMDDGELNVFVIIWNAYNFFVQVITIFFLILLLTTWMRKNLEKTRERLEREGRLYPQGYGRCKNCNTLILPGEVVCRKCGEYIEIPEEMKVRKTEYFECSDCGKEVPVDADVCPFCGAGFEDDEVAEQTFTCSECKGTVPADAEICPHCGERFDE